MKMKNIKFFSFRKTFNKNQISFPKWANFLLTYNKERRKINKKVDNYDREKRILK